MKFDQMNDTELVSVGFANSDTDETYDTADVFSLVKLRDGVNARIDGAAAANAAALVRAAWSPAANGARIYLRLVEDVAVGSFWDVQAVVADDGRVMPSERAITEQLFALVFYVGLTADVLEYDYADDAPSDTYIVV
jgi:hypothetical protein